MEAKRPEAAKPSRTFDEAYGFSFAIGLGLLLFIGGLVLSLTIGQESSFGLVFGNVDENANIGREFTQLVKIQHCGDTPTQRY